MLAVLLLTSCQCTFSSMVFPTVQSNRHLLRFIAQSCVWHRKCTAVDWHLRAQLNCHCTMASGTQWIGAAISRSHHSKFGILWLVARPGPLSYCSSWRHHCVGEFDHRNGHQAAEPAIPWSVGWGDWEHAKTVWPAGGEKTSPGAASGPLEPGRLQKFHAEVSGLCAEATMLKGKIPHRLMS